MSEREPWEHLITVDDIARLNAEGIERYGGLLGPPKDGCVESSVGAAYQAESYIADEDTVPGLVFCGYLLFYLLKNHCFVEGNKRAAWTSAMFALLSLGLTLQATQEEAFTCCAQIIEGTMGSGADVVEWIAARLISVQSN